MIERGREWGGPRSAPDVRKSMTWRRLGRHWRGLDGGGGGTEEERARGLDLTTVVEAVRSGRVGRRTAIAGGGARWWWRNDTDRIRV
jgi:hypothetical protein